MRILIVTDAWDPQINGVVFTLKQTRRELARMGHLVEILHPGMFRTIPCPSYREIRLSLLPGGRMASLINAFRPDALHIATEGPLGLAARRYALKHGMPFTTAYHTRFPEYIHARTRLPHFVSYRWLRWFHGPAVRTMVPTRSVRNDLIENGFDASRIVIWARGVDLSVFHPRAGDELTDAFRTRQRPVFLYAGRIAVEKNLPAFLALDLPGEKYVVGDGPALARLKRQFPDVRFTGAQSHSVLASLYRMADVFVFPSRTDTFGLVLLEAMACGCPVAALPSEATADILRGSGAGVISSGLRDACLQALEIDRGIPSAHAAGFSWEAASRTFLRHLQPMGGGAAIMRHADGKPALRQ
ncbi:glycosyltransferase family 4 protein [Paracandidimonas soli]|uniref:Glycosyltransferase involved in cell wall biosynthesis n=1 Tax=Paracandidimonas soli TaxID=1917182 RepID=A0A4R3VB10_9BURK|nr:glycosyltransferase family 1 protein [Paracandidimonas soli]TCV00782.1 glycosyltransferase involved in cell wall biosynthesis [Paracandidimonas soli]